MKPKAEWHDWMMILILRQLQSDLQCVMKVMKYFRTFPKLHVACDIWQSRYQLISVAIENEAKLNGTPFPTTNMNNYYSSIRRSCIVNLVFNWVAGSGFGCAVYNSILYLYCAKAWGLGIARFKPTCGWVCGFPVATCKIAHWQNFRFDSYYP